MSVGMIHVYTGEGKGKTTAALGLAIRARGHGFRVCYISFHKDPNRWRSGEQKILDKAGIKIFSCSKEHPCFSKGVKRKQIREKCLRALDLIYSVFKKNNYDLLILDEILITVRDKYLKESEVLKLLNSKPKYMELVLTGRGATKRIIKKADLVSLISEVKHYYRAGLGARKGIEF